MTESLGLLLAISVVFVIGIGVAFWWAIFSGQFDDVNEAGRAVLFDDDDTTPPEALETETRENGDAATRHSEQDLSS